MTNDKKSAAIFLLVLCAWASPLCFADETLSPAEQALIRNMLENPKLTPEQKVQMRKTMEDHMKAQHVEMARRQADAEAYWARAMPRLVAPAAPSSWLEKERKFYVDLLALAQPKVLVIPPTVPEDAAGIDITGRVTIARELSRLIEGEDATVPDPEMAYRALGEPRSISVEEIRDKLERFPPLPPAWLIVGTATHDGKGKMRVTFSKFPYGRPLGGPSPAAAAVFEQDGIDISAETPPEIAFAPYAAAAAKALGYSAKQPAQPDAAKGAALRLPTAPLDVSPEAGTLSGVWMQELIGLLYDPYRYAAPRPRERVFERSLAALLDVPKDAPDRKLLLARTMAYLDRRPAALAIIGKPASAEEKALAAYLDSDLGALRSAIAGIKRPIPRLISQLELIDLRFWAGTLPRKEMNASLKALLDTAPPAWHPLLAYHVLGLDLWTAPDPASVKTVMDRDFAVPGYSVQDLVRGKAALGARSFDEKTEVELTLSPLVHAQKWRVMNVSALCCSTGSTTWSQFRRDQYLDLLEADADRLAIQQLHFTAHIQGRPDDMIHRADLYDSVLFAGGHPGVVHQRLLAVFKKMNRAPLEQRAKLGAEGFEYSRSLLTWMPGQSLMQVAALAGRESLGSWWLNTQGPLPNNMMRKPPPLAVEKDSPARVLWADEVAGYLSSRGESAFSWRRAACSGTILSFFPCEQYLDALKTFKRFAEREAAIKALVEPRFYGYPARYEYLAAAKKESGDLKTAEALLHQAIKLPSAPNSAYFMLGNLLLEDGQFAAASKVLLSYPGLKRGVENRVGVSNYASDAAYPLARAGAMARARPLFEIAARNDDGSQASLQSAAQLALTDGRLGESIFFHQRAYQSYHGDENAAAIASILFVAGRPDDAWNVVAAVVPQSGQYAPYRAATVGMRMQSFDGKAILKWREEVERRIGGDLTSSPVAMDLTAVACLQMVFLDRDLSGFEDLFETLGGGFLSWRSKSRSSGAISNLASQFRAVYGAFRAREYQKAVDGWAPQLKSFDEVGYPERMGTGAAPFWSATAYYAFALAKTGKLDEARALPHRLTPEGRPPGGRPYPPSMMQFPMPDFDKKLIAGIAAALSGDHAGAQRLFRGAQGTMPPVGARIIPPDYAFAEILEALTKETGVKAYRDMALAFARGRESFEPYTAWPYAFDAQYSPAGDAQVRATALALKLDPKSERLKKIAPAVVAKARTWLKQNDPFREKAEPPANQSKS